MPGLYFQDLMINYLNNAGCHSWIDVRQIKLSVPLSQISLSCKTYYKVLRQTGIFHNKGITACIKRQFAKLFKTSKMIVSQLQALKSQI